MTRTTSYELGARFQSKKFTGPILWNNKGGVEGVLAYARDEKTGEYVRVYEVGPTEWVDGEPQSWSSGNFENIETAKKYAGKAYRWINR